MSKKVVNKFVLILMLSIQTTFCGFLNKFLIFYDLSVLQLLEAKQDASQAMTRLKQIQGELAASRERCQDQANDLIKKSSK